MALQRKSARKKTTMYITEKFPNWELWCWQPHPRWKTKTNTNTTVKKDQAVKGKTYTVKGVKYKVTANGTKRTVTLVKPTSKNKKSITWKNRYHQRAVFPDYSIAAMPFAKIRVAESGDRCLR